MGDARQSVMGEKICSDNNTPASVVTDDEVIGNGLQDAWRFNVDALECHF